MKKYLRICFLLLLVYLYFSGSYLQYDEKTQYFTNAWLYGLLDTIIITIIMTIIPFILRIKNKKRFTYDKGKKISKINSLVLFGISIILLILNNQYLFIGGFGALIFYYINLDLFATKNNKDI